MTYSVLLKNYLDQICVWQFRWVGTKIVKFFTITKNPAENLIIINKEAFLKPAKFMTLGKRLRSKDCVQMAQVNNIYVSGPQGGKLF